MSSMSYIAGRSGGRRTPPNRVRYPGTRDQRAINFRFVASSPLEQTLNELKNHYRTYA
jgi:hypothetical protein